MKKLFISGIDTDIGKTVLSLCLCEKLKWDYWKPVQTGTIIDSDSKFIKSHIINSKTIIHEESVKLREPLSPHHAAKLEGVNIGLNDFNVPETQNNIIIEGAGGLLVPLNNKETLLDLIQKLSCEVVLASKNYLGSINHTLLSIEILKTRNIALRGIIINGERNEESEAAICAIGNTRIIGYMPKINLNNAVEREKQIQNLDWKL